MADVEQIVKTTLSEIERLLNSKTVVGEPVAAGDHTVIPLVSFGFGFGAGSGAGKASEKGEGNAGGTGGGGGIKPVAVIVIGKDGVRVESIKRAPVLEKVVEAIGKATERRRHDSSSE